MISARMLAVFGLIVLTLPLQAKAGDVPGMIKKKSPYSVSKTIDRLATVLENKGVTVVKRWHHHQAAQDVGIQLRPTSLIIFGNPKIGSKFFTSTQSAAIDLPMKALAWKDANGQVWLGYNDPGYIAERHGIENRDTTIQNMSNVLNKMTNTAIAAR